MRVFTACSQAGKSRCALQFERVGELALPEQGLLTDTAFPLMALTGIPGLINAITLAGRRLALISLTLTPAAVGSDVAEGGVDMEPEAVFPS